MGFPDFDLYEELELSPNASLETIEATFRSLSKRFHPDTARDKATAESRMKRINAAHDVLCDAAARRSYDLERGIARGGASGRTASGAGQSASSRKAPGSSGSARPTGLHCDKCGRRFKTQAGLAWHREHFADCQLRPARGASQ